MPRLWGAAASVGRGDLYLKLAQPDLRPRLSASSRGLPPTARFGDPAPSVLDPREREVVIGLSEGLTREEVGVRLGLSLSTVNKVISNVYTATGFTKTHQLVAWANRCGLYNSLDPSPPQIRNGRALYGTDRA
jgi:DNA-binding NarL/FixJ family response regulator